MNTLPLQKTVFKEGQITSYQSFWVWKPLQPAGTVTYFRFQCAACHPRGTHNFRTKLFSSQTAGKAKPSSYIKHKQCTIGRLTDLRGSSSNTVKKSCNRTCWFFFFSPSNLKHKKSYRGNPFLFRSCSTAWAHWMNFSHTTNESNERSH